MTTTDAGPESERPSLRPNLWPPPPPRGFIARLGDATMSFLEHMDQLSRMFAGSVRAGFRRPFEGRAIIEQLERLSVQSLGIVIVTSVFIGMVMAVQFAFGL